MKKMVTFILVFALAFSMMQVCVFAENEKYNSAENNTSLNIEAKSAVLMEASSGAVLYAKNENAAYSPASVTKIMTLLLAAEALAEGCFALTDTVSISEYAASMGGSQVFLKEGERISVEELFKCTVIASANDAAVALAELVAGSEDAFVQKMNSRAIELGLKSTNFENVTGLDDTVTNHVSSAMDIAVMSRELIKHDVILSYSSLWQDSIRNGEFTLTNTNRLVRFYDGCNGLKTGSTDKAGYCISATAKRNGMQLIAVIMGAETRDIRNNMARELLDFGFANYATYIQNEYMLEQIPVRFGAVDEIMVYSKPFSAVIDKAYVNKIEKKYVIPEYLEAPVSEYAPIGKVEYYLNGNKMGESPIYAKENVDRIGYFGLFCRLLSKIFVETGK